jgi:hypothetical protein
MTVEDGSIVYSKIIEENMEKVFQIRLVVNEFREVTYLQFRKYFLSYEGEWVPSRDGVSMAISFENVYSIIDGMLDICAESEGEEIITKYFNKIKDRTDGSS